MVKQAKAALALLMAPASKGKKASKKASAMKSPEKALQKIKKGMALANASALELWEEYQAVYDKAYFAKETAKKTSTKPLLPRCFSSMQICHLWMLSTCGTR